MIFKQLPTTISDLNKLGIALKSLDAMNISAVGVNTANLESYRTALKGLSVEQSVFALASKGATEEQIRQILVTNQATASEIEAAMAKAGLTTATKALNAEELIALATKKGISDERAKEIASALGLIATEKGQIVSKKQLTVATLQQVGATDAEITAILGLNATETTNIGITNVLTASFAKLWAVITAHPIGAILTAIGAVAVGTIAYVNKTTKEAEESIKEAHEEAKQALEDTKNSLSDDKSELQSVNSELKTTKERLKEISSIGAPTLTEQNELTKLSTANAQLETQQTLLENNIKLKQKAAALDAKELLDTQVEMKYSRILDDKSITSKTESYKYADHAEYQVSYLKTAYNKYIKALEEGNIKKQKLAQELIIASSGNAAEFTSELLKIVESFKYDDGTIIEGYEDIYNEYMGMIYNLQSLTNPDTFLDIAKSITSGTGIDYEKAISEAYALAYEGNFNVDSLNQDFIKALEDAGINKDTVEYIFKLKQQEYQMLIDKINSKYDSSKTYSLGGSSEDTKKVKEEVDKINQTLNGYARENPIEFQLVASYDENFALLDKYIEEEKSKIQSTQDELKSLSKQGNVDLTIRPVIDSSAMKEAGWDVEDGSIATTFTQGEFIWQGGEDDGQYVYVHYTPILPDGTVLTPDQLSNYLYGTLESSKNILEADDKGIVLKVDTDLQGVSAEDIKQLQEKGIQTDGMQSFLNSMGQWDDSVHTVQESYYDMSGTVDYVDNAIKRLVEDAKKAEGIDTDKTDILSFTEAFNAESFADSAKALKELAISGQITPEVLTSTKEYKTLLEQTGLSAEEAAEKIRQIALGESSLSDIMSSMQSHAKLMNTITEEIKENGEISFDTLKSIASQYPQLEKYVTNYLNGVAGAEEELIAELNKQYNADLDNYKDYYTIKQQNDETWFSNYLTNTSTWVNELAKQYNIDLQNYGTYLKAKEELEAKLTEAKQKKEKLNFGKTQIDILSKSINPTVRGLLGGDFTSSRFGVSNSVKDFINSEITSTEQYISDLEKILNDITSQFESSLIDINVGDISDKFKSSGYVGSSSSKTDNTDYWKKEFDDQLATLKHQLAMNQITEAQYYNTLDNLNKKYFANRKEYLSEYRQYEEEVYKGLLSVQKDSLDAINDLIDLRKEMIKDMKEDEIDALKKVIEAEKEKLDAINKSIDARKKAIELLKDEKDHDEEMAEKNKAISDIQVQIDRLALDNSASAQKKKRELEEQLAEKKEDLADYITDYEYDKAIEALDNEADIAEREYKQLEKNLNNQIDAIETYLNDEKLLLKDATNDINGMNETLFTNMKNWAYETTGSVQEVVEKWKEAQKALELYNSTNNVSGIKTTLEESNYENKVVNNNGGTANTPSASPIPQPSSSSGGGILGAISGAVSGLRPTTNNTPKKGKALLDEILLTKKDSSNKSSLNKDGSVIDRLKYYDKDSTFSARSMYWSKIFGGTYEGSGSQNAKLLNYLKSNGYKSGTKKSGKEWAWTQEDGGELIRTKDGALLTPLDNSMVFNNEASMRLWNFSQDPSNFIKGLDLSNTLSSSLVNMKTPNQPVVNIGDININGDMGNLTKSDLNEFRKGIVNDVYESMQKNRVKSGRY